MDLLGYTAAILNSIDSNSHYGMLREGGMGGGWSMCLPPEHLKQQKSRWPPYPRKGPLNISNFERP